MKYIVEVVTGSGATDQREIEARTPREAEDMARRRGLYPIRVVESVTSDTAPSSQGGGSSGNVFDRSFKISAQDRIQFTQKLSTFLKAGLPILPAMEILRDQAPRGPLKYRLTSISRDISAGEPLAVALDKFPKDFTAFYIAAIRAGEASGQLPEILDQLAKYMDTLRQRKRKAITASLYPAILFVCVIGVVFLVSLKYIPLVERFLATLKVDLPVLTAIVLNTNRWLMANVFFVLVLPIILVVLYTTVFLRVPSTRRAIHKFWLSMPGTGWLIKRTNYSWMFRTFGMLSFSGVPVLNAMKVTSAVITNEVLREEMDRIREEVARGESISKTMEKGGLFDRFSVTMLDVGERSGELDIMMNRVADFYDQELDEFYLRMERVAPAVMTLVMAGLVGVVVVALYLPILTIIDTLANKKN